MPTAIAAELVLSDHQNGAPRNASWFQIDVASPSGTAGASNPGVGRIASGKVGQVPMASPVTVALMVFCFL
jgi:hypothetical protein